jgi:hypothetical protein
MLSPRKHSKKHRSKSAKKVRQLQILLPSSATEIPSSNLLAIAHNGGPGSDLSHPLEERV